MLDDWQLCSEKTCSVKKAQVSVLSFHKHLINIFTAMYKLGNRSYDAYNIISLMLISGFQYVSIISLMLIRGFQYVSISAKRSMKVVLLILTMAEL